MTHKEIIKVLAKKRKELKWSYGRLAKESGMNVSTVHHSLKLKTVPDTIRLVKMADALGCEVVVTDLKK
jgi:transcriptional regulator with XRE-family HTH domain